MNRSLSFQTCLRRTSGLVGAAALMLGACWAQHAYAEKLTIGEGVVVKFGTEAGLTVRTELRTSQGTVFTSLSDDTIAGQTSLAPATAEPGDWRGLRVEATVPPGGLQTRALVLRHADTALHIVGGTYLLELLDIADSLIGIAVSESAVIGLDGLSLNRNGVGLESRQNSLVSIAGSDISGNAFGILNLSPLYIVDAVGNWWGSVNGPTAANNPGGDGDAVSEGVDYGQFLAGTPLLDCSVAVADGQYTVALPDVQLALACRNAVEYRLSPSTNFGEAPFLPITASAYFTLQPPAGNKQIHAQYRAATGNTRVVSLPRTISYTPGAPVVSILAPETNAEIVADTVIVASASAAVGIERVDFYVGNQHIGTRHEAPFEQLWQIEGFGVGNYTLRVVARSTAGQSVQATRPIRLRPGSVDPAAPVIDDLRFDGAPLSEGGVLVAPGTLSFAVSAPSSLIAVEARIGGALLSGGVSGGRYSAWLDFASIPNGTHSLSLRAVNAFEIETVQALGIVVALEAPPAPTLFVPVDGSTVVRPQLAVNGTAQPGSQVQVYLDGVAVGGRIHVGSGGGFATTLTLADEGTHRIAADALNSRGTSPSSVEHWVTYTPSNPQISFTSPLPSATIDTDPDIAVAIVDTTGVTQVQYSLDGEPLATLTSPPWTWRWPIAAVSDGTHTLTALAINAAGRTAQTEVSVTVQKAPPPPPPVPTPYVGELLVLAPAMSYGEQPIVIQGRAIEREGGAAVPDALLHIVLDAGGHQRKINVATDADGAFSYSFQPAATDAGTYQVSVRHPEQADTTWQAQFTLDRVYLNPTRYTLRAARTVAATIPVTVTASAGSGVTGLRFQATPSEQPSGSLPPGVQITVPEPITLAAGASRTLDIGFIGSSIAPETGTVVLAAYAQDSGNTVRGRITVPFQLSAPLPALVPSPVSLQGGLAQGEQITLSTQLSNQGLLAAEGVTVQLFNSAGTGPAPAWMNLTSPTALGTLAVGASQPIQVTANPDASVTDGVHQARLRVAAANAVGGDIPVAISVTQSGEGGVRFHAANIYTQTLDGEGNPILGLANARIRLQHETVPTLTAEVTTDGEGIGLIPELTAGRYTWRASAPGHNDASGRVHIQPGVTAAQNVFLDMNVISIEWSVTETTIPDEYEVVIGATYQTEVPAPVVLIEPIFINLPAMQTGEEYSGELRISNYGLVRADNVVFTPPQSDAYLRYEIIGEVPSSLEARERVTLSYKVTALQPLADGIAAAIAGGRTLPAPSVPVIALPNAQSGGTCSIYRKGAALRYDYYCANGDMRNGACSTTWGYTWGGGGQCGGGGGSGNDGNFIYYGWDSDPIYTSLPGSPPGCTPNCKKCCTGGGAGGGGGGGGGGSGPGADP